MKNLATLAQRSRPIRQSALSSSLTILTDNKNLFVSSGHFCTLDRMTTVAPEPRRPARLINHGSFK
ncbi:hypothetical protein, partial [Escherichia coli]|uniref:hypothetical protein n=1 Tax=Escherichia coli TaxID=562 RepID=UPI002284393D